MDQSDRTDVADAMAGIQSPLAWGLPEELFGCAEEEAFRKMRLARVTEQQARSRVRTSKAARRASASSLPFE